MNPQQIDILVREQGPFVFERMFAMMENLRERLDRVCQALAKANVPYAVVGGNAVAAWVSTRDEGAIRTTQDIDILLLRGDFEAASTALKDAGFVAAQLMDVTLFLDGAGGKPSQGVHIVWAAEKVRPDYVLPAPMPNQARNLAGKQVIDLIELVRMKLDSYRRKDQVHLLDMIAVGLIDATWPRNFPPKLAARLQSLLDDPDG